MQRAYYRPQIREMRERVGQMVEEEWEAYYKANVNSMKEHMEVSICLDLHDDDWLIPDSTRILSKNG